MTLPVRSWRAALLVGLAASTASAAELVVQWAPMPAAVEGVQVERRLGDGHADFAPIARLSGDATRFVDRGVSAGVRYCYRVRGVRGWSVSPPSAPLCNIAPERAEETERVANPQPAGVTRFEPAAAAREGRAEDAPATAPPPLGATRAEAPPTAGGVETKASAAPATIAPAGDPVAGGAPAVTPVAELATPEPTAAERQPPPSGGIREVKPLHRPRPEYPPYAQLNGLSGWVKLRFTVAADGSTRDVQVVASEPAGVFDASALEAARRFIYAPRLEDGVAVDRPNVETEITYTWIQRGGAIITEHVPPARR